ncbi:hypothetical protein [Pelomonas sp. Root1217]|nr:hypothetical protein [Pelomonas sp. Root1217]
MSIATGPGFGQRLAAAFADYRKAVHKVDRVLNMQADAKAY